MQQNIAAIINKTTRADYAVSDGVAFLASTCTVARPQDIFTPCKERCSEYRDSNLSGSLRVSTRAPALRNAPLSSAACSKWSEKHSEDKNTRSASDQSLCSRSSRLASVSAPLHSKQLIFYLTSSSGSDRSIAAIVALKESDEPRADP